jgi:hypothetical protein
LYRKGQALLALRRHGEAIRVFERLISEHPSTAASEPAWERALSKARTAEAQSRGRYDFTTLPLEPTAQREVEEFVGPVEVGPAGRKGWGLFVSRDVRPGELLLCERALGVRLASPECTTLAVSYGEGRVTRTSQHDLASLLTCRAAVDPGMRAKLALLLGSDGKRATPVAPTTCAIRSGGLPAVAHLSAHYIREVVRRNALSVCRSSAAASAATRAVLQWSVYDEDLQASLSKCRDAIGFAPDPRNPIMEAVLRPREAAKAARPGLTDERADALAPAVLQQIIRKTPPDRRKQELNERDGLGLTALHYAALNRYAMGCKLLAQEGADVNAQVSGRNR